MNIVIVHYLGPSVDSVVGILHANFSRFDEYQLPDGTWLFSGIAYDYARDSLSAKPFLGLTVLPNHRGVRKIGPDIANKLKGMKKPPTADNTVGDILDSLNLGGFFHPEI